MIRHVVMWKLKEVADGRGRMENAALIKSRLETLPALIPEILRLEVEVDVLAERRDRGDACWRWKFSRSK